MKIKICFIIAAVTLLNIALCGCTGDSKTVVTDKEGNVISTLTDMTYGKSEYKDENYKAFAHLAFDEAAEILADKYNWELDKAKKKLETKKYTIVTTFDKKVLEENLKNTYNDCKLATAILRLDGSISAVFAKDKDDLKINYATNKTNPGSTFKPLSVYAPAIDNETVCWSTMFEDSPVGTVKNDEGEEVYWPQNASGVYTNRNYSVSKAIKESTNTVAVKCLQKYGADNSIKFLKDNFQIDLTYEQNVSLFAGNEQVLNNIALGYFSSGVSVVDMAGFYGIFANEGKYIKPYCVSEIKNNLGLRVYKAKPQTKQVVTKETANLCNLLLREVVKPYGTGEDAAVEGVDIAGKTGTTNNYEDNWFVGVTPEYLTAVWHGSDFGTNVADKIYSLIMTDLLKKSDKKNFPEYDNIVTRVYCDESGGVITKNCKKMGIGYFSVKNIPDDCSIH